MKIKNKIALFTILFVLFCTFTISLFIYFRSSSAIEERVEAQLESVVILKKNQLDSFFENKIKLMELFVNENFFIDFVLEMESVHESADDSLSFFKQHDPLLHSGIREYLEKLKEDNEYFTEFSILTLDGIVHASTNVQLEGTIRDHEKYYNEGLRDTFIQSFYYDISEQEPSIVISTPIKNYEDEVISVLLARLDLSEISEIMLETSGLGETGETYLVNSYNFLVSESRFEEGLALKKIITNPLVTDCLAGNDGHGHVEDYRGVNSIVSYSWLPEREVCLVASISDQEAFQSITNLQKIGLITMFVVILLTITLSLIVTRQLTKNISKIMLSVREIGKGNLDTTVQVRSKDEMGELADSFRNMAKDLKKFQGEVKKYNLQLEKMVKKRTEELENKNIQLEKFNKLAVGREMKMIDLKKKLRKFEEGDNSTSD